MTGQTTASWPDKWDAWCERNGVNAHVEKKEYVAGPFPLFNTLIKNRWLAAGLVAELLQFGDGEDMIYPDISFVAHSNGTDIALRAVKALAARGVRTKTMILVGSVVEPDLWKNGVGDLLRSGMLGQAFAYSSRQDSALGIERWLPWCAYKNLGVVGWKQGDTLWPAAYVSKPGCGAGGLLAITRPFPGYDQGTYFDAEHIESTFAQFRKDLGL